MPSPYIVSVDCARAFDCLDVGNLLALVREVLGSAEYCTLNFCEVPGPVPWDVEQLQLQ